MQLILHTTHQAETSVIYQKKKKKKYSFWTRKENLAMPNPGGSEDPDGN